MFKNARYLVRSPYFDKAWYAKKNGLHSARPRVASLHYLFIGYRQNLDPNPLFNGDWYEFQCLQKHIRVPKNCLIHYLASGWKEGLDPNPLFSVEWYVEEYLDIKSSGVEPLGHFLHYGMIEDRAASGWFVLSEATSLHGLESSASEVIDKFFSGPWLGTLPGRFNMKSPKELIGIE